LLYAMEEIMLPSAWSWRCSSVLFMYLLKVKAA